MFLALRLIMGTGLLAGAIAMTVCGCSKQSNGSTPLIASTTAGATAVNPPPQGPFPRGTVNPANLPNAAIQGPELEVLSPVRGAQFTSSTTQTTVRVRAIDPDGVADVIIAGLPATAVGADEYEAAVVLSPGPQFIEVVGTDTLGNERRSCFSVTQGDYQALDSVFERALTVSLSNSGLSAAGGLITSLVTTVDLEPLILAKDPLFGGSTLAVRGKTLTHDPLRVTSIQGQPNGLAAIVEIDNMSLDVDVDVFGGSLIRATLVADRAIGVATAQHTPGAPPGPGALEVDLTSVDVSFVNFQVQSQTPILGWIVSILQGAVRGVVQNELEQVIRDAWTDFVIAGTLPAIDQPLTFDLPIPVVGTKQLDMLLTLDDVDGAAGTGLGVQGGVKVTTPQPAIPNGTTQVYVTGAQPQMLVSPGSGVTAVLSADAVNAFLHAFWLSGGAQARLDWSSLGSGGSLSLTANLLYAFLPPVRDLAPDPDTPFVIDIALAAPPMVRFGPGPQEIAITAGEAEVTLSLDYMDGGPLAELFTVRLPMTLEADVAAVNDKIEITGLRAPFVCTDVLREPSADLEDAEIEAFLAQVLPFLLDEFKDSIPPFTIPALPNGFTLVGAGIESTPDNALLIRGDLVAPSTP